MCSHSVICQFPLWPDLPHLYAALEQVPAPADISCQGTKVPSFMVLWDLPLDHASMVQWPRGQGDRRLSAPSP